VNERDIRSAENGIGAALGALHAAGPLNAIILVVGIHVVAFAGYGIYSVFADETAAYFGWGIVGLLVTLLVRKVIGSGDLSRRAVNVVTLLMLLGTAFVTFNPQIVGASQEYRTSSACRGYKAEGSLFGGEEWSVNRTYDCRRYLDPADGERSCKAFAATKAHFKYYDARQFCSAWIKGAQLKPFDPPVFAR
jgi:hypothetical protein